MRPFRSWSALLVLLIVVVAGAPGPAFARLKRQGLGAVVAPIRLVPRGSDPLRVSSLYGYFGRVELRSASDGIVVVDHLPLETYLMGLNEVPPDWPEEALEAQAVAARTYALWTLKQPRGGSAAVYGFDICASIECQVFTGAAILGDPDGDRWIKAVRDTAGEAVLYGGEPILARYSSTTGGRTLANSQAFPDERDYPYLRPVSSSAEEGTPLYRWSTRFRLDDLQAILERAGLWVSAGRLRDVQSVPSRSGLHYPDIVFRGTKGRLRKTAEEIREVLRELAPAMFPSEYPSFAPTVSGRLPEVWPANRVTVTTKKATVRVVGRGWGHGVGMSQWGAYGMAQEGADHEAILEHYYTGVDVAPYEDPGPIDVGVAWARREVTVTGEFDIVDGTGRTLVRNVLGDWTFRWAGAGAVSVKTPPGYGLPLRVGVVDAPEEVVAGRRASLTVALSRPARVQAVSGDDGADGKVLTAGRGHVTWVAPEEPGTYQVVVRAVAGKQTRRSETVEVVVARGPEADDDTASADAGGSESGDGDVSWSWAVVVAAIAAGVVVAASRIWAWRKRPSPKSG